MGKPTGFMEYDRENAAAVAPKERIKNFNEFHTPLSKEKQRVQAARCMNCGVPFCQAGMNIMGMTSGCPLHNLVPEWNDLLYTNNWEQAYNRLTKTNNFPEFTSRVCPALCEAACTCGHWEDPVTCKANEHGIIENAYEKGYAAAKPPRVRTGKKVAIIGSGPAGLAAADQLNKRGHSVTVFERDDRVGGLLMYGIPNMKLEKWVIDRKINIMKEEGVEFITNANVGKDIKPAKLLKEYDRVILACGAKNPRDIKAPGRDAEGIYFAVDFLKATTKSLLDSELKDNKYISAKGKKVVIIGGGDTALDDALYLSDICEQVYLIHRRAEFRGAEKTKKKLEELSNVTILTNTRVQEITGEDKVDGIILDNGGTISVDGVFEAVGMIPNTELLKNLDVLDEKGYVIAGEDCSSSLAGLFVAGDVRTKSLRQVVTAVADGAVAIQSATGYIKGME